MNKNPDGTEFTVEQLVTMAVEAGHKEKKVRQMVEDFHNTPLARTRLLTMTADLRMGRMGTSKGAFKFTTRNRFNSPEMFK